VRNDSTFYLSSSISLTGTDYFLFSFSSTFFLLLPAFLVAFCICWLEAPAFRNINSYRIKNTSYILQSKPSRYLLVASVFTSIACMVIPYLSFAKDFELYPLPLNIFLSIILIIIIYMIFAEVTKRFVMKKL